MLVFVYLFGGALHTGTTYVNYVVPGVLLVCLGFSAGTTAVTVAHDMTGSIIDRLRSMNTPATSLVTGHVVASTLRNLVSTALRGRPGRGLEPGHHRGLHGRRQRRLPDPHPLAGTRQAHPLPRYLRPRCQSRGNRRPGCSPDS
jgi:hypothetical protein